jgi:hypothetical protein
MVRRLQCCVVVLWSVLGAAPAHGVLRRQWKDRTVHGALAKEMLASQLQHCASKQVTPCLQRSILRVPMLKLDGL